MQRRDQMTDEGHQRWVPDLDRAIEEGLADVAAGRVLDAESVFDRLEAKYRAIKSA